MREKWITFALLAAVLASTVSLAVAPDYQTLSAQPPVNEWVFWRDSVGVFAKAKGQEIRAYVKGADSSLAKNQIDGTYNGGCECYRFSGLPRDMTVDIYMIDLVVGADSLLASDAWLKGAAGAKDAVDDTTLASNAVTLAKMADNSVGSAELVDDTIVSADVQDASLATVDLADALITPAKISTAGGNFFSGVSDSVTAQTVYTARLTYVPGGGVFEIVGPFEVYGANDVKSAADVTFLSGSSLLASSGSTVTLSTAVTLGSGSSAIHVDGTLTADQTATMEDSLRVGTTFAAADSQSTGVNVTNGFIAYVDGIVDATYPAATSAEEFKFPGAIPGRWRGWVNNRSNAAGVISFKVFCVRAGVVTVTSSNASAPPRAITIFGFNKW